MKGWHDDRAFGWIAKRETTSWRTRDDHNELSSRIDKLRTPRSPTVGAATPTGPSDSIETMQR